MGRANGLQYIIEAAKCLKEKGDDTVRFFFMGRGATEPIVKKLAEDYGLTNVSFLGSHKMDVVSEVVNCCDASITTFLNLPVLKTNSPNKLFDSLSAGKPIIVNSAGWKDISVYPHEVGKKEYFFAFFSIRLSHQLNSRPFCVSSVREGGGTDLKTGS